MKIAFIDLSGIDFDIHSPNSGPLGGMQSGLCYLAQALQERGHEITVFNGVDSERVVEGVRFRSFAKDFTPGNAKDKDIFISISCKLDVIKPVTQNRPLILFTGHNSEEPTVQSLTNSETRNGWDRFVFKTNWQAETLRRKFQLDPQRISIITNAAATPFINMGERKSYFFREKRPPVLYYSSTPFRGLEVLAQSFASIRRSLPGTRAIVFSSMKPYHDLADDQKYNSLYEFCRHQGMEYVGSLSQPALARSIASADILAFPSVYPETSCITLMEGMLNNALIITRSLGAIPETCAGFGFMMREDRNPGPLHEQFAQFLVRMVKMAYSDPIGLERHLYNQRQFALKNYNWNSKAKDWEHLLVSMLNVGRLPSRGEKSENERPVYNFVHTISGSRLFINLDDGRAQQLLLTGGALNLETQALWRAALKLTKWDVIIDIGANYGEMLLEPEVHQCPCVLAIEPNPKIAVCLKQTLRDHRNTTILEIALSDLPRREPFSIHPGWSGMSRLGAGPGQIEVEVSTIDALMSKVPAITGKSHSVLLKIDVEGSELDVIAGGASTIDSAKEFCAVIEIDKLSVSQLRLIEEKFDVYGLRLPDLIVEKIGDLTMVTGKKTPYWHQDVMIVRKGHFSRELLALIGR